MAPFDIDLVFLRTSGAEIPLLRPCLGANTIFPGNTNGAGGASPYILFCRIADSTSISCTISSNGGGGGISWTGVEVAMLRLW